MRQVFKDPRVEEFKDNCEADALRYAREERWQDVKDVLQLRIEAMFLGWNIEKFCWNLRCIGTMSGPKAIARAKMTIDGYKYLGTKEEIFGKS